jgi:hypothetical protein
LRRRLGASERAFETERTLNANLVTMLDSRLGTARRELDERGALALSRFDGMNGFRGSLTGGSLTSLLRGF